MMVKVGLGPVSTVTVSSAFKPIVLRNGLRDVDTVRFAAHISWSTSSRTPGKKVYATQKNSTVNPIHMRPCSAPQPG